MLIRKAIGLAFKVIGEKLLGPEEKTNGAAAAPEEEAPKPKRPRARYNPKEHKTFYMVGSGILRCLLEDGAPKTVHDFTEKLSFAQSTIRGTCKELVKEGLLVQVTEYPAAFKIPDEANEKAKEFVAQHAEENPPSEAKPAENLLQ